MVDRRRLKVLVYASGTFIIYRVLNSCRSLEMEFVVDFSSNTFSATIETQSEVAHYISAITPNNFLAFLDFMKDANYVTTEDFVIDQDYSVAEY